MLYDLDMMIIDAHCDTLTELDESKEGRQSLFDCDLHFNIKKAARYRRFMQVTDLWVDSARHDVDNRVNTYIDVFNKQITNINANADKTGVFVRQIFNDEDITEYFNDSDSKAKRRTEVALLLGIEGGECIGNSLDRLEELYAQGVRLMTLTWNTPNYISDTHMNKRDKDGGLTDFGRDVVRKMNELGMIIDVSHISDEGYWGVLETTSKPIVASHSDSRNVTDHSRNLTDDMFRALIKNGGVTGINFCTSFLGGTADLDQIIKHIEHFAALGGIMNVGIGSDFDGIDVLPAGIGGAESLYKISESLLRLNYKQTDVDGVMGKNFLRVMKSQLKGGSL